LLQRHKVAKIADYPSPDSSGNPFVTVFGTKDCNG